MLKIWTFVRHNSGIVIGFAAVPLVLFYAYGCQSTVKSLVNPSARITRPQLQAEVDYFLAQAEAKFADLDRQDLFKSTLFNAAIDFAQGKAVNPVGVASVIGSVLGLGAVVDNVRKRTHINTLKGGNVNVKVKKKT